MQIRDILSRLGDDKRQKAGELLRFCMVGVTAVLLQYAIYGLLLQWCEPTPAMTVGYLISFLFNFFASTRYTFKVKASTGRGIGFALSHIINYLLQMGILNLALALGVPQSWAPIPMFVISVPVNFLLVRFFLKTDGTGNLFRMFRLRREERLPATIALVVFTLLNALTVCRYYDPFTFLGHDYWQVLVGGFQVSGFDSITYYVVTEWEAHYNVYRHPLLSFFMYAPHLINKAFMWLSGINCAPFVVGVILIFCSFYSFLFLYRILRRIVGLRHADALLLDAFFFSFAFVMVSTSVPDHFIMSLFLLLFTLYISGLCMLRGRRLGKVETLLLFVATAGVTLNNGLKIFLAALFTNGRRFFSPRFVLSAVLAPALLMWGFCRLEYRYFVRDQEQARHAAKVQERIRKEQQRQHDLAIGKAPTAPPRCVVYVKKKVAKQGVPMAKGEFLRWTDGTTDRGTSVIENLFGESLQLHQDFLLQDVFRSRPVIVPYRWAISYGVEAAVVLLFIVGVWCGRRSRFLWTALSFFALDLFLHIGLGFGLNEVYIMSCHWMYVIPIAVAYLFRTCAGRTLRLLRIGMGVLTLYLWLYNSILFTSYMIR